MRLLISIPLVVLYAFGTGVTPETEVPTPKPDSVYSGMCEASAAVAFGADRFLVANDEDNVLRLYHADKPEVVPVLLPLDLKLDEPEDGIDIEGAAEVDGTIYWTTSHSRTKKGKIKPDRFRFFGATVKETHGEVSLAVTGFSERLMDDLLTQISPELGLDDLKVKEREDLAPEKKGTNIEGLAAWGTGQLLIGFRNPLPGAKALLIPLENPAEVIQCRKARFGKVIQLDLGGLGIRSIERLPDQASYLIVAGSSGGGGNFRLYRWSPGKVPEEMKDADLAGLGPEAIVFLPGRKEALLLSDDGDSCKEPPTFRARWIALPKS